VYVIRLAGRLLFASAVLGAAAGCELIFPSTVAPPTDAGAPDAPVRSDARVQPEGGAQYNDIDQPSYWSFFDTTAVSPRASGFAGAAFDGRYVYLVPQNAAGTGAVVTRYDKTMTFVNPASWSTFDPTTVLVDGGTLGFNGGTFDGRYVYLVPLETGVAVQYDTQASFSSTTSWSTFDTRTLSSGTEGFAGAAFDGTYVYLVPNQVGSSPSSTVLRYNPTAPFGAQLSWSTFDASATGPGAAGFVGAVFDGRYIYFVPNLFSIILRYDVKGQFGAAASWTALDTNLVIVNEQGFFGGVFDGDFIYLVPHTGGVVARFDTRLELEAQAAWSQFDTTSLSPQAAGFSGGAFDGRYVYLVPFNDGALDGVVARYDTTLSFTTASAWSTFGVNTLGSSAQGFVGGLFDGSYIYLVPGVNGTVARFNASTAPVTLGLPAFHGSFY
jgi:uncharacterized protein YfaQ (DUF2300 family)